MEKREAIKESKKLANALLKTINAICDSPDLHYQSFQVYLADGLLKMIQTYDSNPVLEEARNEISSLI